MSRTRKTDRIYTPLSKDEISYIEEHLSDMTPAAIARYIGCYPGAIWYHIHKNGWSVSEHIGRWTRKNAERFAAMFNARPKTDILTIANEFELSPHSVYGTAKFIKRAFGINIVQRSKL